MSASNWATCPRCLANAQAGRDEAVQHALSLYGAVPLSEFEETRAAAEALLADAESFQTFREDYEIYGAEDGTITVSYGGACQVCSLSHNFKDLHPFYEIPGGVPNPQCSGPGYAHAPHGNCSGYSTDRT